jgi:hypothetical protein
MREVFDMRELKQSTTAIVMLYLADDSDEAVTGATLAVTISKGGGAFGSISPTVTERDNGWYAVELTADHTDTLGDLVVRATAVGAVPAARACVVVANIESDTFIRLGSPTGASIAADINAIPTNPLLDDDVRLDHIDADISTRATQVSVDAIPTNPLLDDDVRLDHIDADISTRLAAADYVAPDNTSITAIKDKTDNLPQDPASNTQVNTRLAADDYVVPPSTEEIFDEVISALESLDIEQGLNIRQTLSIIGAAVAGILRETAPGIIEIKALNNNNQIRVVASVNRGERLEVTLNPPE